MALLATERCRPLRPSVPLALVGLVPVLTVAAIRGPANLITEGLPFLLPATAILLARMATTLSPRLVALVVAAVVALTGPLFLVARHGHDAYQQVTAADRTGGGGHPGRGRRLDPGGGGQPGPPLDWSRTGPTAPNRSRAAARAGGSRC